MPRVWVEVVDQTGRSHESRVMNLDEDRLSELEKFFYENIRAESLVLEVEGESGKAYVRNPVSAVVWREQ